MASVTSTYRYPPRRVMGDYLRSAAGLVLTGVPATQLPVASIGFAILIGLATLFAILGLQGLIRSRTRVVVSDAAIESSPCGGRVHWREITKVDLAYFSTRRDRRNGWMQLTLRAGKEMVRVDSRLEGFDRLAARSVQIARDQALSLSLATATNFRALGHEVTPEPGPTLQEAS